MSSSRSNRIVSMEEYVNASTNRMTRDSRPTPSRMNRIMDYFGRLRQQRLNAQAADVDDSINGSNRTRGKKGPDSALQNLIQTLSHIETNDIEYECPICFEKIILPDCISCTSKPVAHRMHYSCYLGWSNKKKEKNENVTCPVCRNNKFTYCSSIPERKSVERKSVKLPSKIGKRYRSAMTNSSPSGGKRRKSSRPRKIQSGNVNRRTIKHRNKRM